MIQSDFVRCLFFEGTRDAYPIVQDSSSVPVIGPFLFYDIHKEELANRPTFQRVVFYHFTWENLTVSFLKSINYV